MRSLGSEADCPASESASFWNGTAPPGSRPVAVPYLILFDGSAGSSWFAECLDRHPRVFVAGYESLEWHSSPRYSGWNATAWQPGWLSDIWHLPEQLRPAAAAAAPVEAAAAWRDWLARYLRNEKLDPERHRSPLTVHMPHLPQLSHATAVGFKVRPGTIAANHLGGTLREALRALGGRLLVVNRRNAVKQALSLYRRRVEGRGQFLNSIGTDGGASVVTPPGLSESRSASFDLVAPPIEPAELLKLLRHREQQDAHIECAVRARVAGELGVPAHYVWYEELLDDFGASMRGALRHLGVSTALSAGALASLRVPAARQAEQEAALEAGDVAAAAAAAGGGAASFVKVTPDSLCVALRNLPALCRHFKGTPYEAHFEPFASRGCRCDEEAGGAEGGAPADAVPASIAGRDAGRAPLPHANSWPGGAQGPARPLAAGNGSSAGPARAGRAAGGGGGGTSCVLVGTHHKTGTVLMGQVLRTAAQKLERFTGEPTPLLRAPAANFSACVEHAARGARALCLVEHAAVHEVGAEVQAGRIPLIHLIRDPLEICVSGYQYHLASTEPWLAQPKAELGGRSWRQYFEGASEAAGVVAECVRALPEIKQQLKLYAATKELRTVRSVRLEAIGASFSSELAAIFSFVEEALGLDPARGYAKRLLQAVAKYNLAANAPREGKAGHVSDSDAKRRLRAALLANGRLRPVLTALQRLLDYPPAAPAEPSAAGDAAELAPTLERLDEAVRSFWANGMQLK